MGIDFKGKERLQKITTAKSKFRYDLVNGGHPFENK